MQKINASSNNSKSIIYIAKYVYSKDKKTYLYIGQTNQTLEQRIEQHEKAARSNSPTSFHQALINFGLNNFEWNILFECNPEDANKKEKETIDKFCNDTNCIILNDSGAKKIKRKTSNNLNNHIPKSNRQINFKPNTIGKMLQRESGTLKPVINIKTNKQYESLREASRKDNVSIDSIRRSCKTGKKLKDGSQYAFLNLEDEPILTEGHSLDIYIGKKAKKVKELISGKIYTNATEAAKAYNLSKNSIDGFARGKYLIAKGKYIFCFLDKHEKEITTPRHKKALKQLENKNLIKYVAWHIDDEEREKLGYFKTLNELNEKLKLKRTNKGHIKEVCDGKRSHIEGFRVAYYDNLTELPILKKRHKTKPPKVIRELICLDNNRRFKNQTEAGKEYSVEACQIGLCASGRAKSVRIKNKKTGKTERLRFAYLDNNGKPKLTNKHKESLSQRKGISRIMLTNEETIKRIGKDIFDSLSEYCRVTKIPYKRAKRYINNKTINLLGHEFIVL